jgi:hypothetical protein
MALRDTVIKRLAPNASLNHTDEGAKERLINTICKDIDGLTLKYPTIGIRVWNRIEWKLPSRNFTAGATEVAVWKSMFMGVRKEVIREGP